MATLDKVEERMVAMWKFNRKQHQRRDANMSFLIIFPTRVVVQFYTESLLKLHHDPLGTFGTFHRSRGSS